MSRQTLELVRTHPNAVLPKRATNGSFGYDLAVCEEVVIRPGETKILPTGWKLAKELPLVEYVAMGADGTKAETTGGIAMLILPRSSLPLKYGLIVANSPGLIDADYTGEIGVIVHNLMAGVSLGHEFSQTSKTVVIPAGTRIAQFILPYLDFFPITEVREQEQLAERGGFGSTG